MLKAFLYSIPLILLLTLENTRVHAQDTLQPSVLKTDSAILPNPTRVKWVAIGHAVTFGGSLTGLSILWYANYPRSGFHFFNDDAEWLQMDKAGHSFTAFQVSRTSADLWQWAGLPKKKSVWLGGLSGLAYQSIIEVLDGFSAEYGFSPGDYGANVIGTAAFVSQELTWGKEKFKLKFSFYPKRYVQPDLEARANKIYGKSIVERIVKDYNSQNYWISADIHSLFHADKWPSWLNIAVGYGANGMFGAMSNIGRDKNGNIIFDRSDIRRYRQWFLSPDLNFLAIKTHKKAIRTLLFVLDAFKLPAPALELSQGKLKGHLLYF